MSVYNLTQLQRLADNKKVHLNQDVTLSNLILVIKTVTGYEMSGSDTFSHFQIMALRTVEILQAKPKFKRILQGNPLYLSKYRNDLILYA